MSTVTHSITFKQFSPSQEQSEYFKDVIENLKSGLPTLKSARIKVRKKNGIFIATGQIHWKSYFAQVRLSNKNLLLLSVKLRSELLSKLGHYVRKDRAKHKRLYRKIQ